MVWGRAWSSPLSFYKLRQFFFYFLLAQKVKELEAELAQFNEDYDALEYDYYKLEEERDRLVRSSTYDQKLIQHYQKTLSDMQAEERNKNKNKRTKKRS